MKELYLNSLSRLRCNMAVVTLPIVGTKMEAFCLISSSKFLTQAKLTAMTPSVELKEVSIYTAFKPHGLPLSRLIGTR